MARRRTRRTRRASNRRVAAKRVSRRSSGMKERPLVTAGSSFAYGFVRNDVQRFVAPVTGQFGNFGEIADELALGTLHWLAVKNIKNRTLKNLFIGGLSYEAGRAGELVRAGAFSSQASNGNGVRVL
jgi:hypothetical protein